MRKLTFTLALALGAMLFTGCSQSDILPDTNPTENPSKVAGQTIHVTTTIETPKAGDPQTRVGFKIDDDQKLNLLWNEGDKVTVYPYFANGTAHKAGTPVEATMGTRNSDGTYNMSFSVTLPEGITLDDNLRVSGALGVDGMTDEGKASIAWDNTEISTKAAGNDFKLPMYFAPSKVTKLSDNNYFIKAHFKVYGSLINLKLESHLYDPFEPREFLLKTKNFSSEGTMNLADATATTAPSWTPSDATSDVFVNTYLTSAGVVLGTRPAESVNDDEAANGQYFLWAMPKADDASENTIVTATVHDFAYAAATREGRSEPLKFGKKLPKLVQGMYYGLTIKMESDLIITEVMVAGTNSNAYEVYNPTDHDIVLSDYSLVAERYDNLSKPEAIILGKTMNNGSQLITDGPGDCWVYYANPAAKKTSDGSYILPPGKTCVYFTSDRFINNWTDRNSAWITFKFSATAVVDGNRGPYMNTVETLQQDFKWMNLSLRKTALLPSTRGALDDKSIVDVFFRTMNPVKKSGTDLVASYLRRPDRNFPRKWSIDGEFDKNSDWVYKMMNTNDLGYRYAPYDHVANGKVETSDDALTYPSGYYHAAGAQIAYIAGGLSSAVSTEYYFPPYYWNHYWSH